MPDRAEGLEHLELLVTDRLPVDPRRGLHRDQAEQLQQVVLEHVAQRAGLVVVAAAGADADGLGDGDLHVVDRGAVPQRLEEAVREAGDEEVLHALLAQVVVDAEDLRLVEDRADGVVDRLRRGEVVPDRLLQHDPGHLVDQAVLGQACRDGAEEAGCAGQVVDPDAAGVDVPEPLGERAPVGLVDVDADVLEAGDELFGRLGVEVGGGHEAGQLAADLVAVAVVVEACSRRGDDADVGGQLPVAVALVEGGQQLADGEVAGAAEDDDVAGSERGGSHEGSLRKGGGARIARGRHRR